MVCNDNLKIIRSMIKKVQGKNKFKIYLAGRIVLVILENFYKLGITDFVRESFYSISKKKYLIINDVLPYYLHKKNLLIIKKSL